MKKIYFFIPVFSMVFLACRKTPDTTPLLANFVVQTSKDPNANFADYKTYYISDTIALKTDNPKDSIWFDNDSKKLVDEVKKKYGGAGVHVCTEQSYPS